MGFLTKLRATAGAVARARVRREAHRFLASTRDCRGAQHRVLRELLELNGDSEFARQHDFAGVHSVRDFRRRIGVADYEYFRPAIERVKNGELNAFLGSRNKLLMFSLSSGTTGESKFVPITTRFLEDYRRGWQTWGILTFDDHFPINWKNIVQLASDYDRFRTPGGTPCGNISGLVGAMQKKIVRLMYTLPLAITKIPDPEAKLYTTLRIAIADGNVGMVTTANPSTLVQLARTADSEKERLIRDLADGTLSADLNVDAATRRLLNQAVTRKRPKRARELERIVERTDRLLPRDFWDGLETVAVWTGGSCAYYLETLRELYGNVPVRDHGLHASEGRMTIPLSDETPGGVLDVSSHFFEFVPEEEYESPNPTVLEAHELEEGREYFILLTTASGLCRYDIHDVVRCTGFHGDTPMLEFLHKGAHISNVTGEKVSESQVVAAVRSSLNGEAVHVGEFTLAPVWGDPPGYTLLVENRDALTSALADRLADRVDRRLQELNCEYREKRETRRLAPMTSVCLTSDTWREFARTRQGRIGGSVEQYKHPYLVPDLDFAKQLAAFERNGFHDGLSVDAGEALPAGPTSARPRGRQRQAIADRAR